MSVILRYFTEFGNFRGALRIKVVEDVVVKVHVLLMRVLSLLLPPAKVMLCSPICRFVCLSVSTPAQNVLNHFFVKFWEECLRQETIF